MFAEIPIISPVFQALLDSLGWVLARIFDLIPNYGVAIVILTLLIRLVLFPLGMKQIKSMQHMQALQPKIKEIQKKYKNNKQKAQEETMRLYREAGVNPLGGCLPVLAQFPLLIAMYAVIRAPQLEASTFEGQPAYTVVNNHLPVDSQLFGNVITHEHTGIGIANLQCSVVQAGTDAVINDTQREPVEAGRPLLNDDGTRLDSYTSKATLDCGDGGVAKVGYVALLLVMVGTAFYQQRMMQRASPQGSASSQQQAIMKIMPLFFGFIGINFPAGLVLYWTTANVFQIGQQMLLLRAGHIGPDALERRMAEQRERQANKANKPQRRGLMASMLERADDERKRRDGGDGSRGSARGTTRAGGGKDGTGKDGTGKDRPRPKGSSGGGGRSSGGRSKGSGGGNQRRPKKPGSGGSGGSRS
jgi:YidC/Oxa1 family membrane protein insertase